MSNEIVSIEPAGAVDVLRSRWLALLTTTGAAAIAGFLIAPLLPATWQSDVVIQVGQVGDDAIENPAIIVRRVNSGILQCGVTAEPIDPAAARSVTANPNGAVQFLEIRLTARGRTADEAFSRSQHAVECVAGRLQRATEAALRRSVEFRTSLAQQRDELGEDLTHFREALARSDGRANATDLLLLESRLNEARGQLLHWTRLLQEFDERHEHDTPTTVLSPPSKPLAPTWPRPSILAAMSGAAALFLCAAFFLATRGSTRSHDRLARTASRHG